MRLRQERGGDDSEGRNCSHLPTSVIVPLSLGSTGRVSGQLPALMQGTLTHGVEDGATGRFLFTLFFFSIVLC